MFMMTFLFGKKIDLEVVKEPGFDINFRQKTSNNSILNIACKVQEKPEVFEELIGMGAVESKGEDLIKSLEQNMVCPKNRL
jgi:hypothetical protein